MRLSSITGELFSYACFFLGMRTANAQTAQTATMAAVTKNAVVANPVASYRAPAMIGMIDEMIVVVSMVVLRFFG